MAVSGGCAGVGASEAPVSRAGSPAARFWLWKVALTSEKHMCQNWSGRAPAGLDAVPSLERAERHRHGGERGEQRRVVAPPAGERDGIPAQRAAR